MDGLRPGTVLNVGWDDDCLHHHQDVWII